jgi:uncharacterized protein involved in exopolysaccharide biosynthesis
MRKTDENPTDVWQERMTPSVEGDSEIDLRFILRVLWRRKAAIFSTVILLCILCLIVLYQVTPRYTSSAQVILDPRENQIIDIEAVVSGLTGDVESIESEIEIIRSRSLAEKAIQKLKLYENPEFNARLRSETFWQSVVASVSEWIRAATGQSEKPSVPIEDQFDQERVSIINTFGNRLSVKRLGRSRVIEISFESEDPRTVMLAANTIADLYLVEQLEATFEGTQRATNWLGDRLADLREAVELSESAVESYRQQEDLVVGADTSLVAQQISQLSTQLIIAKSTRAESQARLRQVTNLINSSGGVDSVAEVLASPLIQNLREQEAQVDRRIAELSNEYGDKHPRMINIRAEMKDLQSKISGEVDKVVQNLRNEVSVARAREASLSASLAGLEERVTVLNSSEIELRALMRDANANRELYETFLTRFKETSIQGELQQSDSRIIARAELPTTPTYPRKGIILMLVIIGSTVLGVVLAFSIEQLDHGFRSMGQVEMLTGLPSLGLVPTIKKGKGTPETFAIENPLSTVGEAIRTIYVNRPR